MVDISSLRSVGVTQLSRVSLFVVFISYSRRIGRKSFISLPFPVLVVPEIQPFSLFDRRRTLEIPVIERTPPAPRQIVTQRNQSIRHATYASFHAARNGTQRKSVRMVEHAVIPNRNFRLGAGRKARAIFFPGHSFLLSLFWAALFALTFDYCPSVFYLPFRCQ